MRFDIEIAARGRSRVSHRSWFAHLIVGVLATTLTGAASSLLAQQGPEDRKCRHILVRTEAKADEILQKLEAGEDFARLARTLSLDVVTKPLAGELGWIAGRNYESDFERAAFSVTKVGEAAKCRTQHGWHVIQVTEVRNLGARRVPKPDPPATTRPGSPTENTQDRPRVNNDLTIEFELEEASAAPGEDVLLSIGITNNTEKPQEVFNPVLWPLGLTARYQFGRLNVAITHPDAETELEDGLQRVIEPLETLSRSFRLQDFTGDLQNWPLIRMNWRANIFFLQIEKHFPAVREIEGYDEIRSQWKYYASRPEQRLNILPDFSPQERWFAMLHARGKIWVELEHPQINGLLPYWVDLVRQGVYDKQKFAEYKPGQYFLAGGTQEDGSGHPRGIFALDRRSARVPGPHSLSLEIISDDGGFGGVGSRFYLGLANPGLTGRAIPIGRVIPEKGTEVLANMEANYEIRGQVPRVMLALMYPYDLLPDDVKEAADKTSTSVVAKPTQPLPELEIQTDQGTFTVQLFEDDAPNTVANFVRLTESGFYDGLAFHDKWSREDNRGFVIGGSPDGSTAGGAGYTVRDEINGRKHLKYSVAFARGSDPHTASSQFYICLQDQPFFDGVDTVVGHVVRGKEVVDRLDKGVKIQKAKVLRKREHAYEFQKYEPGQDSNRGNQGGLESTGAPKDKPNAAPKRPTTRKGQ